MSLISCSGCGAFWLYLKYRGTADNKECVCSHWASGEPNNSGDEDCGELENNVNTKSGIKGEGKITRHTHIHSSWDRGIRQQRSWHSSVFSNFNNHCGGDRFKCWMSLFQTATLSSFSAFFFFFVSLSLSLTHHCLRYLPEGHGYEPFVLLPTVCTRPKYKLRRWLTNKEKKPIEYQ